MAFVKVLTVSALPSGSTAEVLLGGHAYVLCNFAGEIHALDGECPCSGGPLSKGTLQGPLLVCPWHGRRYDCRTGQHHFDAGVRVSKYVVRVDNGAIFLDVPSENLFKS